MSKIDELRLGFETAYINGSAASNSLYRPQFVSNNHKEGKKVLSSVEDELLKCDRFQISVAFITMSGITPLLQTLKELENKNIPGEILTTNYLNFSEPGALKKLNDLSNITLKMYDVEAADEGFHTKGYIFRKDEIYRIIIGSSNITSAALTSNREWNTKLISTEQGEMAKEIVAEFKELWNSPYALSFDTFYENYKERYQIIKHQREAAKLDEITSIEKYTLQPNSMQVGFITNLKKILAAGEKRALLISATGTGKTYASAFAMRELGFRRVLFLVHRGQLARQTRKSYEKVFANTVSMGLVGAGYHEYEADYVFATVQTLNRDEHLLQYAKDVFDCIVLDEFHHAVNDQYRRIIEYFEPKFLLGLTATPDRMDGRNIYEICDYNVPYEISLGDAINKGMLVPFHYYGIYDDTDYSGLHIVRGKYDEKELNETYIGNSYRYDLIYKYYCKYGSDRALGFCCSRAHAEEMAKEFSNRGIPSVAVYSDAQGAFSEDRVAAIDKLKSGEIRVIFSVDMFNEGVDITSVDMVMFLRPTESPIVFLQQLGRGLRKCRGKEYLNVLDFIGNYEKAGQTRFLLTGKSYMERHSYDPADKSGFPDDCLIDFDMRLIDLFKEMDKKSLKIKDLIEGEYVRIKELTGKQPSRMELFTYMDDDIYQMTIRYSKDNIFKHYLDFLNGRHELSDSQAALYSGKGREFISILENTNMSKVYKMPVLMAFYNHGDVQMQVTEEKLLKSWKEFFDTGTNWKDLKTNITFEEYQNISDKTHISNILKNPVHFLQESGKGFFIKKDGFALALRDDLKEVIRLPEFAIQMKDVIEYRTMDYYQRRYRAGKSDI